MIRRKLDGGSHILPAQSIEDVRVVTALLWRQPAVRSHANESHLGRVADEGARGTSHHSNQNFLQ